VKDIYYHDAITYKNYKAILILYESDKRNKNKILYKLYKFFDFHDTNSKIEFSKTLKDFNENPILKIIILKGSKQIQENNEKRKKTFSMIKQNDKNALIRYFNENNIRFEDINNFDRDILIYAINNDVSIEIIQFLVQKYEECNLSLNYGIEFDNRYIHKDVKLPRFENPLHLAIAKNNFEVANLLIEKGADINFEIENMEPIYLYKYHFITHENLDFMLNHGFNKYIHLLKQCIYNYYYSFDTNTRFNGENRFERDIFYEKIMDHYLYNDVSKQEVSLNEELKREVYSKKEKLVDELLSDFVDQEICSKYGERYGSSSESFYDLIIKTEENNEFRQILCNKYNTKMEKLGYNYDSLHDSLYDKKSINYSAYY